MERTYMAINGPAPTTAAPSPVATGTSIKTLLQIATPSTRGITILEWGISFDGVSASAAPIKCELLQTDVGATITQYGAGDLIKWGIPNDEASVMDISSTTKSGYTSSGEGSITAARPLDVQLVSPTSGYVKQFPLGREPAIPVSKFLRIRVTAAATVNAYCYVIWSE